MSRRTYILLSAFLLLANIQWAQLYTFNNYNHRDGLNTESTLSSVQDQDGYLWVGTDGGGLMRFDGKNFQEMGSLSSVNSFHVSSIIATHEKKIVFATLFDGIYSYSKNNYQFIYKPTRMGDTKSITQLDANYVLVAERAIQIITKKGVLVRSFHFPQSKTTELHQVLKVPGAVLVFTSNGNYAVYKDKVVSLNTWLGKHEIIGNPIFGSFQQNRLTLYHKDLQHCTEISLSNFGEIIRLRQKDTHFKFPETEELNMVAERNGVAYALFGRDHLYKLQDGKIHRILVNSTKRIYQVHGMSVDNNDNLWINSHSGLFKVSIEPFTRVGINPVFGIGDILFVHQFNGNKFLISNSDDQTFLSPLNGMNVQTFDFGTNDVSENKYGTFVATSKGVYELKDNKAVPTKFPYQEGKDITLIFFDGTYLWYAIRNDALYRYSPGDKQVKKYKNLNIDFPRYFYTARTNFSKNLVYFGTNNGILEYSKESGEFTRILDFVHIGSYCGNSTVDKYGTIWFTLDKGIVGITKQDEHVSITDPKKLPSTLFYTLTSDKFGNLLVGTNKGINVIRVNSSGNILKQRNFSYYEGFGGYETNMRACYQNGNVGYVGTIEGLFQINTDVLEHYPLPPAPKIFHSGTDADGSLYTNPDARYYIFYCVLGKSARIQYSYRLKGYTNTWSHTSPINKFAIPELSNGSYTLEVRATYDGINFSPIAREVILIQEPIYKTKWFLVLVVIVLGVINIAFLEWSKSYFSTSFSDTNILAIDIQLIPKLIIFSIIISILLPIVVNLVQTEFVISSLFVFIQLVLLTAFYMVSVVSLRSQNQRQLTVASAFGAYLVMAIGSIYQIYTSNIHPCPVFQLTIMTSVLPFLTSQIRIVVIICLSQILLGVCMLIWLDNTLYNEVLFLMAVTVSCALAVMFSYIRLDSLEKLIFVNGLINRGNVVSISFNKNDIITYCSSNIREHFSYESDLLIGKPTSVFNDVVVSPEFRESKIGELFVDGKAINIPMISKSGSLIWMEWTCKKFSDEIRVIMGQDVTEKLTLSTNYQSLVENANDMIFNTDINGNFIFVNEQTNRLLGYRTESIIGKNSLTLVVPEYRDMVEKFYNNQFENGIQHSYLEYPARTRDGKVIWLGQNTTMVYEPGSRKRISGFIALARDITERRAKDLLLEQQNLDITSSINSAKRLQFNLLPDQARFSEYFQESFLFFKPKDIVSGDFFWIEQIENKVVVALADCTGHGISGAFLTIMGINLLNKIVCERKISKTCAIVHELGVEMNKALRTENQLSIVNEMDILVMVFEENKVSFSSTGVGLIVQHQEQLKYHRNTLDSSQSTVECVELDLTESTILYLLTDGYQKQFGSIKNKKFGSKRILELLEKIQQESLSLQKKYIENTLRNWSEGHEQTDDITVIGLKNFKLPS